MRIALFCLGCLLVSGLSAAEPKKGGERAKWERQMRKVSLGMRREQVEQLLPPYNPAQTKTIFGIVPYSSRVVLSTGGSQTILYYVSEGWRVSISYDYTGTEATATNVRPNYSNPDNRVVALPTLEYRLEPAPLSPDLPPPPAPVAGGVKGKKRALK
jgi:hypothetical protein